MTERLESALSLAAAGYRVFPAHGIKANGECTCGKKSCGSAGKHPVNKGWQNEVTTDPERIKALWAGHSDFNPAIATGDGLLVLDIDGKTGKRNIRELEARYGKLPDTRTVVTGSGGLHYYFHASGEIPMKVGAFKEVLDTTPEQGEPPGTHIDIRGDGGLVIAPRAMHRSGKLYEWELLRSPEDLEEAEAPEWLLDLLKAPEAHGDAQTYNGDDNIPEGQRNDTLYRYGCSLRGQQGKTMQEISEILHKLAEEKCNPPLPRQEVNTILRQIDRFPRQGGADQAFQPTGIVWASDVKAEEARFVIKPYIPEGQLTMIQGNPGDGKTAFACKLAALVSTGEDLLGLPVKQGKVLMLSVEDDKPVLRGRIEASGGDLSQCAFVENESGLTFCSPEMEQYIMETQAKLVIFDPVQAFLGAKVDMHRANETRPILAALKEIAQRYNCAIVIICHLNKRYKDNDPILGSLGSVDIIGACRSMIHIGRRGRNPNERLMIHGKSSSAQEGKNIIFSIGEHGMVDLKAFTNESYDDLSTLGKKVRQAAEEPFLAASVVEACKKVLAEHPNGTKIKYDELDVQWPESPQPKKILEALASRLYAEGIQIQAGVRTTGGKCGVLISKAVNL